VIFSFDEEDLRRDVTRAMEIAGHGLMDMCLQDVETVNGRPETLATWTRIAQEVGAERYNP
jgi:hypothetical protein